MVLSSHSGAIMTVRAISDWWWVLVVTVCGASSDWC